jgi:hypothetical protein
VGVVPTLFGLPGITGTSSSSSSSGLNLSQSNQQDAVVKAALFAYDAKSGHLVWESGTITNAEGLRDQFVFGTGPDRRSSLPEVENYPAEAKARVRSRFWSRLKFW